MTTRATALMSASLSKPKSIMTSRPGARSARRSAPRRLRLDVDGARVERPSGADALRRRGRIGRARGAVADAVLEALHRAAEIAADVLQLLGAEDQHDDQEHDQPMPDAERTHGGSPIGNCGGF